MRKIFFVKKYNFSETTKDTLLDSGVLDKYALSNTTERNLFFFIIFLYPAPRPEPLLGKSWSIFTFIFQPTLPSTAMCRICENHLDDDEYTLMECALCGKIVHPTCMPAKGYFYIVPDLNNCWKCPECCDKDIVSESIVNRLRWFGKWRESQDNSLPLL